MELNRSPVYDLLQKSVELEASDLHISVGSPPVYRIHGELHPFGDEVISPEMAREYAKAIMTEQQYEKFMEMGEFDFSIGIPGISRFRINAYLQRGTVGIAARRIPSRVPTLDELSLPPVLKELAQKPHGLVLVTGPTGSGKTTTLAAMIDYINQTAKKHILTLEDPIEYLHQHKKSIIHQREVGTDTRSFANGLRAALRQDPDVILVGEMRDLETISTAITAAETGHLVLATLHTSDAPSTIDRIIDAFPGHQQAQVRIQLATVLAGVISQRLLPRKDGKGRVAATEILINTPAVSNLIRQEKVHQIRSLMQTGRDVGMHTMDMVIQQYIRKGLIEERAGRAYLTSGYSLLP